MEFILGIDISVSDDIQEYSTRAEADMTCDEWVVVTAPDVETAKASYYEAYDAWYESERVTELREYGPRGTTNAEDAEAIGKAYLQR
jgi:hypothetical protein